MDTAAYIEIIILLKRALFKKDIVVVQGLYLKEFCWNELITLMAGGQMYATGPKDGYIEITMCSW